MSLPDFGYLMLGGSCNFPFRLFMTKSLRIYVIMRTLFGLSKFFPLPFFLLLLGVYPKLNVYNRLTSGYCPVKRLTSSPSL